MALSIRLQHLTDDALLGSTGQIVSHMEGHHLFPDADPSPALIARQAAALEQAIGTATENMREQYRRERRDLIRLLRQLGLQILRPADSEKPLFYISGLDSMRLRIGREPQDWIEGVFFSTGMQPGSMIIGCMPVKGLRAYLYEYTADAEVTKDTKWITTATTRHIMSLENLTPGQPCHFRMAVIGRGPDHCFCSPVHRLVL